jgi:hypothetical protein
MPVIRAALDIVTRRYAYFLPPNAPLKKAIIDLKKSASASHISDAKVMSNNIDAANNE